MQDFLLWHMRTRSFSCLLCMRIIYWISWRYVQLRAWRSIFIVALHTVSIICEISDSVLSEVKCIPYYHFDRRLQSEVSRINHLFKLADHLFKRASYTCIVHYTRRREIITLISQSSFWELDLVRYIWCLEWCVRLRASSWRRFDAIKLLSCITEESAYIMISTTLWSSCR